MIRRAALRAFMGAAFGAGAARKAAAGAAGSLVRSAGVVTGVPSGIVGSSRPPDESKWKRYYDLLAPSQDRREVEHLREDFLGGMPPGVASNHSWAPWFRAHVAAKRIVEARKAQRSWEEKVRAYVFDGIGGLF